MYTIFQRVVTCLCAGKRLVLLVFLFLSTLIVPPIEALDQEPAEYKINHDGHQQAHQGNIHAHGNTYTDQEQASSHYVPKPKVDCHKQRHACRPNRIGTSRDIPKSSSDSAKIKRF